MRAITFVGALYFFLITFTYASTVNIDGQVVHYASNATLGSLASALIKVPQPYWPACHIRNDNSQNEAKILKRKILHQLANLHPENLAFQKLTSDIERFTPYGRLDANLNPDLVRLRPEVNFRLHGNYHIQTQSRPNSIKIIGLTSQGDIQNFKNTSLHTGLVQRERYLNFAENNFIYLISPDGKIQRINNAYWNYQEEDILPGSVIYIPIKTKELTMEMKHLNQDIVQLFAAAEERNE